MRSVLASPSPNRLLLVTLGPSLGLPTYLGEMVGLKRIGQIPVKNLLG